MLAFLRFEFQEFLRFNFIVGQVFVFGFCVRFRFSVGVRKQASRQASRQADEADKAGQANKQTGTANTASRASRQADKQGKHGQARQADKQEHKSVTGCIE